MNYIININRDDEADVWYAICDDIPLALEHPSFDILIKKIKDAAYDVLDSNNNLTENTNLIINATHKTRIA